MSQFHTLYVKGINDKIKIENVKKSLYLLFGQCGEVIDVMIRPGNRWRGQAWVVFKDQRDATRAKTRLHGEMFYGKLLSCEFAKAKSDIVAKADGTYVERSERAIRAIDDKLNAIKTEQENNNATDDATNIGGKKRGLTEDDADADVNIKRQKVDIQQEVSKPQFNYKVIENTPDNQTLINEATILYATNFPLQADQNMIQKFLQSHNPTIITPLSRDQDAVIRADIADQDLINFQSFGYLITFSTPTDAQNAQNEFNTFKFDDDFKLRLFYVYDISNAKNDPQQEVSLTENNNNSSSNGDQTIQTEMQ